MIWKQSLDVSSLHQVHQHTLSQHLGIEFTEIGDDFLEARMPVDDRTRQPMGLLHGGASVVLAETLGSVAALLCIDDLNTHSPVGVEINANHLRSVTEGYVIGRATPVKIGRQLQVWQIDIKDDQERLICVSRITIAVVAKR